MRIENSYRIIPCYTADVSGVCSALFELGGMVVMHDPSGCNSTYNTHDETRWYNHDSLIYITALTEQDAIMGNDKKAVCDIIDAAHRLSPRFIALCGSPIPYLNGTDYKALARIIERETGITSFAVETNGMHDYVQGAGAALLEYAKHVLTPQWDDVLMHDGTSCTFSNAQSSAACTQASAKLHTKTDSTRTNEAVSIDNTTFKTDVYTPKSPKDTITINILGATPLDFAADGTIDSLKSVLTDRGFNILSVFSMLGDSNIDSLAYAVLADVNLVISSVGYRLAQYMLDEYGIPLVVGMPVGGFTDKLCEDLAHAAKFHTHSSYSENASAADAADHSVTVSHADIFEPSYTCRYQDYERSDTFGHSYACRHQDCKRSSSKRQPADCDIVMTPRASSSFTDSEAMHEDPRLAIIGEPVTSGSIAAAITVKYGIEVSVLCPLESCELFLTAYDHHFKGEQQCTKLMQQYKHIIADPLYLPICPDSVNFHRLPHAAFSGRCCRSEMQNLVTLLDNDIKEANYGIK